MLYWNRWNTLHIAEHSVTIDEARYVFEHAKPPFPRVLDEQKIIVKGQTATGRYLQVIFVQRSVDTVDPRHLSAEALIMLEGLTTVDYIIHARDMTDREKHQLRRRRHS